MAEIRIKAGHDAPVDGQTAVSDADGRVSVTITRPGMWVVRTVHMRRCTGCANVEWESFWTSYGFSVR